MNFFLNTALSLLMLFVLTGKKIKTYEAESPYQNGKQKIRVLLPDSYPKSRPYRVLYLLPISGGLDGGLEFFQRENIQNRHDLIVVEPAFEKMPWFGDHVTDLKTRQASYMREFVVPFIESRYDTVGNPEGRLLIGFSKGGWGAFSLILKNPDFYGYAASWDSPMLIDQMYNENVGMIQVFGTLEHFYRFRPDLLAVEQKAFFQDKPRLVLAGEKIWGPSLRPKMTTHTVAMHDILVQQNIPHVYDNTLTVEHRWDSGWIGPVTEALMRIANSGSSGTEP